MFYGGGVRMGEDESRNRYGVMGNYYVAVLSSWVSPAFSWTAQGGRTTLTVDAWVSPTFAAALGRITGSRVATGQVLPLWSVSSATLRGLRAAFSWGAKVWAARGPVRAVATRTSWSLPIHARSVKSGDVRTTAWANRLHGLLKKAAKLRPLAYAHSMWSSFAKSAQVAPLAFLTAPTGRASMRGVVPRTAYVEPVVTTALHWLLGLRVVRGEALEVQGALSKSASVTRSGHLLPLDGSTVRKVAAYCTSWAMSAVGVPSGVRATLLRSAWMSPIHSSQARKGLLRVTTYVAPFLSLAWTIFPVILKAVVTYLEHVISVDQERQEIKVQTQGPLTESEVTVLDRPQRVDLFERRVDHHTETPR